MVWSSTFVSIKCFRVQNSEACYRQTEGIHTKWWEGAIGVCRSGLTVHWVPTVFSVQKQQLLTIVFVQVQEVLFLVDHKPTEPMHWLCSSHKTLQVISSRLHGLSQEFHQLGHALCVLILFAVARCGWCLSLPLNLPYHADGAAHSLRPVLLCQQSGKRCGLLGVHSLWIQCGMFSAKTWYCIFQLFQGLDPHKLNNNSFGRATIRVLESWTRKEYL